MSEHELRDVEAKEGVGVQIGAAGHRLWVCIDGQCVLRVKAPRIELEDQRANALAGINPEAVPDLGEACEAALYSLECYVKRDPSSLTTPTIDELKAALAKAKATP